MEKTKEKKTNPKVVVFGEEVGDGGSEKLRDDKSSGYHYHFHDHHHHRGSFVWGVIFILVGFLFLLSNFGALPPIVWSQLIHLWPILVILIGFDILLGHSEASEIISSIIGIFLFITIFGAIIFSVSPHLLSGLPIGVLNYFHSIDSYLHIK